MTLLIKLLGNKLNAELKIVKAHLNIVTKVTMGFYNF